MAVSIAGFSVIVRNGTIESRFPGGVDAYKRACPNGTFCTDGKITRVGFMAQHDMNAFVREVAGSAFISLEGDVGLDVAVTSQTRGFLRQCDWLQLGTYEGRPVAWLAAEEPGNLFIPAFEWNSSAPLIEIGPEELKRSYEPLRTEDGVQTYRNKNTGQEMYVGSTTEIRQPRRWWQFWR